MRRGGDGRTIIAGYPWFTDWGRDTFIAAARPLPRDGRLDDAREILLDWAGAVSEGMLPNRFPDAARRRSTTPSTRRSGTSSRCTSTSQRGDAGGLAAAPIGRRARAPRSLAILDGYAPAPASASGWTPTACSPPASPACSSRGWTRSVGDWVVTPRIGKPVEVQALWLNALRIAGALAPRWREPLARGRRDALRARFWNEDARLPLRRRRRRSRRRAHATRPAARIRSSPSAACRSRCSTASAPAASSTSVEARLLTPLGLRSLAPGEPGYAAATRATPRSATSAYHQGTVWPWLIGPFVDACAARRPRIQGPRHACSAALLRPLVAHLDEAGLGHVSEIADGEPPFTPRGCPFQAWSLGELRRARAAIDRALAR